MYISTLSNGYVVLYSMGGAATHFDFIWCQWDTFTRQRAAVARAWHSGYYTIWNNSLDVIHLANCTLRATIWFIAIQKHIDIVQISPACQDDALLQMFKMVPTYLPIYFGK